ncbi:hypothetical protein PHSC3_001269 [Chlamydiales bacterium STE3]|nr:hypothetical protein PHSC3_001269 [Chlamydiales bacterium STE3]
MLTRLILFVFAITLFFTAHPFPLFAETKQAKVQSKKTYSYYPSSDRIAVIFIWDGDRVAMRQAFAYTSYGTLAIEVNDDGYAADINDLSGVSYRQVRYFTPNPSHPFGPPLKLEEKVLDLATKQEVLERAYHHFFSPQGKLIRQDIYDANHELFGSLQWEYDQAGNMIRQINLLGEQIVSLYDANGNCVLKHGPKKDKHWEFVYDNHNRLVREDEVYPEGSLSKQYRYDASGNLIAEIDCYGNEKSYVFNELGYLAQIVEPLVLNEKGQPARPVTSFFYNQEGFPYLQVDPKGNETKMSFTKQGKISQVCFPDGSEEKFEYTSTGELAKKTLKNGCVIYYTRDYQDRIVQTECFSAQGISLWSTSAQYNAFHLISERDALGIVTKYEYDIFDRKIKEEKAGHVVLFEYDASGRLVKKTNVINENENVAHHFSYNAMDQITEEKMEFGPGNFLNHKQYIYNEEGKLIKEILHRDAGKEITHTVYNSFGKQIIDPCGKSIYQKNIYNYKNAVGQCVPYQETVDASGCTTIVIKDALGKETEVIKKDPEGKLLQRKKSFYDLVGLLSRVVETVYMPNSLSREEITCYEYDSMQRCISKIEAANSVSPKRTSYSYNILGYLTLVEKPSGKKLKYNYNTAGLLQAVYANDLSVFYTYVYDAKQRLVSIKDELTQKVLTRSYDALDRLIQETLPTGHSMRYTYDALGNVQMKVLPDGSKIVYKYSSGVLKSINRLTVENRLQYSHEYLAYDKIGQPLEESFLDRAGHLTKSYARNGKLKALKTRHFTECIPRGGFDALGNLTKRILIDSKGKQEISYAYNHLGKIISEVGVAPHSYGYDSSLKRVAKDEIPYGFNPMQQLIENDEETLSYDLDGNLIAKGDLELSYDAFGRLTGVKDKHLEVSYAYDAFHRRLSKTLLSAQGKRFYTYFYDGEREIGCYLDGELKEVGILGIGINKKIETLVSLEINGHPYAVVNDCLGNVVALLNPTSSVCEAYRYTAFGEGEVFDNLGHIKNALNTWGFRGMRYDKETGFYYNGLLYYYPTQGDWVTRVPDRTML